MPAAEPKPARLDHSLSDLRHLISVFSSFIPLTQSYEPVQPWNQSSKHQILWCQNFFHPLVGNAAKDPLSLRFPPFFCLAEIRNRGTIDLMEFFGVFRKNLESIRKSIFGLQKPVSDSKPSLLGFHTRATEFASLGLFGTFLGTPFGTWKANAGMEARGSAQAAPTDPEPVLVR